MGNAALRRKIIERLNKSEDERLLSAIYDLLRDESKKETFVLSEAQMRAIEKAELEANDGKTLSDAEVRRRTKAWLGK